MNRKLLAKQQDTPACKRKAFIAREIEPPDPDIVKYVDAIRFYIDISCRDYFFMTKTGKLKLESAIKEYLDLHSSLPKVSDIHDIKSRLWKQEKVRRCRLPSDDI